MSVNFVFKNLWAVYLCNTVFAIRRFFLMADVNLTYCIFVFYF